MEKFIPERLDRSKPRKWTEKLPKLVISGLMIALLVFGDIKLWQVASCINEIKLLSESPKPLPLESITKHCEYLALDDIIRVEFCQEERNMSSIVTFLIENALLHSMFSHSLTNWLANCLDGRHKCIEVAARLEKLERFDCNKLFIFDLDTYLCDTESLPRFVLLRGILVSHDSAKKLLGFLQAARYPY